MLSARKHPDSEAILANSVTYRPDMYTGQVPDALDDQSMGVEPSSALRGRYRRSCSSARTSRVAATRANRCAAEALPDPAGAAGPGAPGVGRGGRAARVLTAVGVEGRVA